MTGVQTCALPICLGNEAINQNPEVFFFSTDYRPIDELATISILDEIFTKLAPTDPLNKKHSTQGWAFLRDVQSRVSDLKREGISPVVFQQILDDNEQFFTLARPIIASFLVIVSVFPWCNLYIVNC